MADPNCSFESTRWLATLPRAAPAVVGTRIRSFAPRQRMKTGMETEKRVAQDDKTGETPSY